MDFGTFYLDWQKMSSYLSSSQMHSYLSVLIQCHLILHFLVSGTTINTENLPHFDEALM